MDLNFTVLHQQKSRFYVHRIFSKKKLYTIYQTYDETINNYMYICIIEMLYILSETLYENVVKSKFSFLIIFTLRVITDLFGEEHRRRFFVYFKLCHGLYIKIFRINITDNLQSQHVKHSELSGQSDRK